MDYTEKLSGLSIESFLILPVQRIPRYVLLLQDLLKYTNATHQDFNNLSYQKKWNTERERKNWYYHYYFIIIIDLKRNALSFIKDLADFINSNKSDADNINKILAIQEALIDLPEDMPLVVPRRRYIDEGVCFKIIYIIYIKIITILIRFMVYYVIYKIFINCLQGLLYKKQKAWVYLFSDALVFTKVEKKGKKFKTLINLPTASLNITDEPGMLNTNIMVITKINII